MSEDTLTQVACANGGALLHWAIHGVLGISVVASGLANLRKLLPAAVLSVLDKLALNFVNLEGPQ